MEGKKRVIVTFSDNKIRFELACDPELLVNGRQGGYTLQINATPVSQLQPIPHFMKLATHHSANSSKTKLSLFPLVIKALRMALVAVSYDTESGDLTIEINDDDSLKKVETGLLPSDGQRWPVTTAANIDGQELNLAVTYFDGAKPFSLEIDGQNYESLEHAEFFGEEPYPKFEGEIMLNDRAVNLKFLPWSNSLSSFVVRRTLVDQPLKSVFLAGVRLDA